MRVRPFEILGTRRVPTRLAMSEGDCGAACLASILSYHGHNISTSDCAELLGTGRDGATAEVIYQTAEALGLKTEAFRLAIDGLAGLRLPAIVHVDEDHFVVLESIGDRGYRVFDPGGGRHWLTREDFGSRFAGVALTFTPTPKLEKRRLGRASGLVAYFRSLLSTHGARGLIAKVLVASFFLQFLGLAFPMATMLVIDEIIPGELSSLLHWVAGGMIVLTVADALLGYLRTRVLIQLQVRLDTELMTSFVRHLLSLPYNFFQSRTSGDLLMRLESNSVIREALTNQTLSLLLDGALGITYVILLFTHVPSLAWTVLAIVFFQGFLLVATTRRVHELSEREIASDAESESYLIEVLSGIATVKGSGAEPNVFSRWSRLFHRQLGASVACERLNAGLGAVTQTLDTLTPFLLLWMGAHHVLGGALSAGAMLAVNAIAMAAIDPLVGILDQAQNLQRVGAHLDRLQDALNATPEQSREASRSSRPLRGQISLCNIGFRYQPRSPWVLKDLSLSVKPGEKVAIVGRSGAGKSTLVQLLIGLQEPTEGSVRYDGVELNALDRSQLRRQIGLVLQDPFVFSGSLRSNIALHDPDLANARVVEAIRLAGLEDDVARFPRGIETPVGEGGTALSGGQVQRLALARALVTRPRVLVLDEATSHLDAATEQTVDAHLSGLDCTRIIIAHRLTTVRDADRIFVLGDGRITEEGTHTQLLRDGGLYASLVNTQPASQKKYPRPRYLEAM